MSGDKPPKPEACNFCDFDTSELDFYVRYPHDTNPSGWLCQVCASTLAGNNYHNPGSYDTVQIMKQISYCTNLILRKINGQK